MLRRDWFCFGVCGLNHPWCSLILKANQRCQGLLRQASKIRSMQKDEGTWWRRSVALRALPVQTEALCCSTPCWSWCVAEQGLWPLFPGHVVTFGGWYLQTASCYWYLTFRTSGCEDVTWAVCISLFSIIVGDGSQMTQLSLLSLCMRKVALLLHKAAAGQTFRPLGSFRPLSFRRGRCMSLRLVAILATSPPSSKRVG